MLLMMLMLCVLVSRVGEAMGDFITYIPYVDEATGKPVIDDAGYYKVDFSEMKKVGNFTPKVTGGFGNTVTVKDFYVDFLIDFRFGGEMHFTLETITLQVPVCSKIQWNIVMPTMVVLLIMWMVKPENIPKLPAKQGPNGERVFHDGVILDGVKSDGSANDVIIDAASYYLTTFTWGLNGSWAPNTRYDKSVYENSYIKFREAAIGYNLPKDFASKIGFQSLTVSLIGRNLFYLYKTFPNADPKVAIGSRWTNQAVDSDPVQLSGASVSQLGLASNY